MSAYFGRFHGELPALYFQESNATFLEQIILKTTMLLGQVILIVPNVRGHRGFVLVLKDIGCGTLRAVPYKRKRGIRAKIVFPEAPIPPLGIFFPTGEICEPPGV